MLSAIVRAGVLSNSLLRSKKVGSMSSDRKFGRNSASCGGVAVRSTDVEEDAPELSVDSWDGLGGEREGVVLEAESRLCRLALGSPEEGEGAVV
jgi:hypothetical protein